MTLQVLLSMAFGFGVLALATVALLNTAGHRLHELEVFDRDGPNFAFVYRYNSKAAARLRLWFSRLPLFVGLGAFVAILVTYGLHAVATAVHPPQHTQALPIDILTWTMLIMGGYVLILVLVASILSAGLYHAIRIFRSTPFTRTYSTNGEPPHR